MRSFNQTHVAGSISIQLNQGLPWADGKATLHPSKSGTPLVTFFYEDSHTMAPRPDLIVQFFQEHQAP